MTTRKIWPADEKLRIVLEGLHPNANVEAICRAHGLHSSQFYKWKEQALASMKAGLASQQGSQTQHQRQEIARLKRLIAEQAIALQVFKEELSGSPEGKNDGGGW
jgi:transposase-like protein